MSAGARSINNVMPDRIRKLALALCSDELFANHACTLLGLYRDHRDMELTQRPKKLDKKKFERVRQATKRLRNALGDDVFGYDHSVLLRELDVVEVVYTDRLDLIGTSEGRITKQRSLEGVVDSLHDWFNLYGVNLDKLNGFIESSLVEIYPTEGRPTTRTIQTAVSAVRN